MKGYCLSVCDAVPVGWETVIDDAGCPRWKVSSQSCLDVPPDSWNQEDAGDAGTTPDAADESDAAPL